MGEVLCQSKLSAKRILNFLLKHALLFLKIWSNFVQSVYALLLLLLLLLIFLHLLLLIMSVVLHYKVLIPHNVTLLL